MKKPAAMTYLDGDREKISSEFLRNKLKLLGFQAKSEFTKKYPYVKTYLINKGIELENIREHSARLLQTGALAGALLLSTPSNLTLLPSPIDLVTELNDGQKSENNDQQKFVTDAINSVLPTRPRPLSNNEEKYVEFLFRDTVGIKIKANLEGEHLNTTYGYIGYEQHLKRFPGDVLENHGEEIYTRAGIAPGLGAFGYFAKSKAELTPDLIEKEKWYAVVQTLYLPDWNRRSRFLKEWYRHRKVLIVNTVNGNAVVAAIADSGPAAWTGKQFGGSPEVMDHLGGLKYRKGSVLLFFVDDPENKVALGPVNYKMMDSDSSISSRYTLSQVFN
jgi:hypothetical protein